MPIRPEDRERYPPEWDGIARWVRDDRAQGRCECAGECGSHTERCDAPDLEHVQRHEHDAARWVAVGEPQGPGPWSPAIRVVLAVAHLDRNPEHVDPSNLCAMCQRWPMFFIVALDYLCLLGLVH